MRFWRGTSIEHAEMLDDNLIALAKQHGTYLDMDIYDEECIQAGAKTGKHHRTSWPTTRS